MVVMNESFSDLTTYLEGYETSTDPMPYVRSLMKRDDVVSGTCAVSSDMGTGTANSEFEFLTGNSMAYFKGNTPYVQFIDAETPSLASLLAGRGYSTMAMHAYERAGYNRVKVYDRFGFEAYKGIEDFDVDLDYARGYPTDEAYYRQLISYFETVDEPTVVLFFGDHEPRLSNEFYSSWFTDENDLDLETTAQLHKTPFFIWGNYSLSTESIQKGSVVSLNYLSTVLFQTAGCSFRHTRNTWRIFAWSTRKLRLDTSLPHSATRLARRLRRSPIRSMSISGFNTTAYLIEPIAFQGSIHRKAGVSIYGGLVMVPCKENGCFAKISICV